MFYSTDMKYISRYRCWFKSFSSRMVFCVRFFRDCACSPAMRWEIDGGAWVLLEKRICHHGESLIHKRFKWAAHSTRIDEMKLEKNVKGKRKEGNAFGGQWCSKHALFTKKCIHLSAKITTKLVPLKVLTPYKQRGIVFSILWNSCGIPRVWKLQGIKLCIVISNGYLAPDTTGTVTCVLWFKEIKT